MELYDEGNYMKNNRPEPFRRLNITEAEITSYYRLAKSKETPF